jgi:energy-coupling factor transport system ATP-binding protein
MNALDQTPIKVMDLAHVYPGEVRALKGVNLVVHQGDILGVIGHNGSGKTTIVKHFNGLLKPTSGEVYVYGVSTQSKKVYELSRLVGYVYQNPDHQLFLSTVEEEIKYGPKNIGMDQNEIIETTEDVMTKLGIVEMRQMHPFQLTRLYRKLLSIACVLAMKPNVIVLDEPTTGQDIYHTQLIAKLIKELSDMGKTLVIVSHDMSLIAENCNRVIVMNDGLVLADDSPEEVFSQADLLSTAGVEPPDITRIASGIQTEKTILSVGQMMDFVLGASGN